MFSNLSETSLTARHALYNEMDQILIDNAAIVPLYYDRVLRFSQINVKDFEGNPMNLLNLKRVKK